MNFATPIPPITRKSPPALCIPPGNDRLQPSRAILDLSRERGKSGRQAGRACCCCIEVARGLRVRTSSPTMQLHASAACNRHNGHASWMGGPLPSGWGIRQGPRVRARERIGQMEGVRLVRSSLVCWTERAWFSRLLGYLVVYMYICRCMQRSRCTWYGRFGKRSTVHTWYILCAVRTA